MAIALIILLVMIFFLWYEIFRTRELVIKRCQRVCREAELQFLDQTIAVISVRFGLDRKHRPVLYRTYQFEYSENSVDRYKAYVDLHNNRIVSIRFTGPDGKTVFHH